MPDDQPTIQAGIDAATDGDTVVVTPGTYVENIDFGGKAITVEGEGGAELTVIDGNEAGPVATFSSGETAAAILRGFTIRNGRGAFEGGGVLIEESSPTVEDNIISGNEACSGGGLAASFSAAVVRRNLIRNNLSGFPVCVGGGGGGMSVRGFSPMLVVDNRVEENEGSENGGGLYLNGAAGMTIEGNTIARNRAAGGGGIGMVNDSSLLIVQNLVADNSAGERGGGGISWSVPFRDRGPFLVNNTIAGKDGEPGSTILADGFDSRAQLFNNIIVAKQGQTAIVCPELANDPYPPVIRFNDVFAPDGDRYGGLCADQTGVNGNISADPGFVDPSNEDFRLESDSPAIDAGSSGCVVDCSLDGSVSVDELVLGVNLALGALPLEDCLVADRNGDNLVTVDELVAGVNNALTGCLTPVPVSDLDESPRPRDGDGDGEARVDLGVYEAPAKDGLIRPAK